MTTDQFISPARLEAFSDGVMAILVTVMVFELKWDEPPTAESIWADTVQLLPKFLSYALSFAMLGVMWISHHRLFHQVRHVDGALLWYNILLLFWMSLVPFATGFLGSAPMLWHASFGYGAVFFLCALSFSLLRGHVHRSKLLHGHIAHGGHGPAQRKNGWAMALYLCSMAVAPLWVYGSFFLFAAVPVLYIIPEKIVHLKKTVQE
jgi:uncharacterized membrane protein